MKRQLCIGGLEYLVVPFDGLDYPRIPRLQDECVYGGSQDLGIMEFVEMTFDFGFR